MKKPWPGWFYIYGYEPADEATEFKLGTAQAWPQNKEALQGAELDEFIAVESKSMLSRVLQQKNKNGYEPIQHIDNVWCDKYRLTTDTVIKKHLRPKRKKDKGNDGGTEWYINTDLEYLELVIQYAIYLVDAEFKLKNYCFSG